MRFDNSRPHDPKLHCPPEYGAHADTVPATLGGWLRHEWRPVPNSHYTEAGTGAKHATMVCIHCRKEEFSHA